MQAWLPVGAALATRGGSRLPLKGRGRESCLSVVVGRQYWISGMRDSAATSLTLLLLPRSINNDDVCLTAVGSAHVAACNREELLDSSGCSARLSRSRSG